MFFPQQFLFGFCVTVRLSPRNQCAINVQICIRHLHILILWKGLLQPLPETDHERFISEKPLSPLLSAKHSRNKEVEP